MTKRDYREMNITAHDTFELNGTFYELYSGYHDASGIGGYYKPTTGGSCVLVMKKKLIDAQGHSVAALLFN